MAHRIRYAMTRPPLCDKLQGTVEADETYFGGEAKNMHADKRAAQKITGRGTANKVPVFSVLERGGEVRSQVMKNVTGQNVKKELTQQVESSAILNTDTSTVYPEAANRLPSMKP
jgi:transposase-like protein